MVEGGLQSVYQETTQLHYHMSNKSKMVILLNFKVQQVAVNLVVDVGIVFLLAQVKAGDVHRRLKRETHCWLVNFNWKTSKNLN